jgi:hypothetical protein
VVTFAINYTVTNTASNGVTGAKRPLERARYISEDNIKTDLKEVLCERLNSTGSV